MPSVKMSELTQHHLCQLCNITGKRTTVIVDELITAALVEAGESLRAAADEGKKNEDFGVDRLGRVLEQYQPVDGRYVIVRLQKLVYDGFSLLGKANDRQTTKQMAWLLTEEYLRHGYYPPHSTRWAITRRSEQVGRVLG